MTYWSVSPANISSLFQHCLQVNTTSGRHTASNTNWNNVVYVNFEIYSIEQRRINVVCLKVDLNNIRQGRNKFAIFTVNFHNVGQRWNNVMKRQFEKNIIVINNFRVKNKIIFSSFEQKSFWLNMPDSISSSFYSPFLEKYIK